MGRCLLWCTNLSLFTWKLVASSLLPCERVSPVHRKQIAYESCCHWQKQDIDYLRKATPQKKLTLILVGKSRWDTQRHRKLAEVPWKLTRSIYGNSVLLFLHCSQGRGRVLKLWFSISPGVWAVSVGGERGMESSMFPCCGDSKHHNHNHFQFHKHKTGSGSQSQFWGSPHHGYCCEDWCGVGTTVEACCIFWYVQVSPCASPKWCASGNCITPFSTLPLNGAETRASQWPSSKTTELSEHLLAKAILCTWIR